MTGRDKHTKFAPIKQNILGAWDCVEGKISQTTRAVTLEAKIMINLKEIPGCLLLFQSLTSQDGVNYY